MVEQTFIILLLKVGRSSRKTPIIFRWKSYTAPEKTVLMTNVQVEDFELTRSCAALRAADLGLSGQDAIAQWHSFDPKMSRDKHRAQQNEKVINFVTHAGSQLTIMTQDEKVIIFHYPPRVTTDFLDV